MKYIAYKKSNNTVFRILDNEPNSVTNNLEIARCETIPKGNKFVVVDIQEKQEEYIEKVTKTITLATGEEKEIIKAITKTRNYKTCVLVTI